MFPQNIIVGQNNYKIEVIIKKKKNSSVYLKNDKLIFYLPSHLNDRKKIEVFNILIDKIKNSKSFQKPIKKSKINLFKRLIEQGYFIFKNKRFYIEFEIKRQKIFYNNEKIILPIKYKKEELLEKVIIKYLSFLFLDEIKNLVEIVNRETFNFKYGDIKLSYYKTKYGHCTSKNDLAFNLSLFNSNYEIIRYVIIHELAHIKEKNHSSKFWDLVKKYCPNYKILKKELKENSPNLINF